MSALLETMHLHIVSSPVLIREAAEDVTLKSNGTRLANGEKIALSLVDANRDESVFGPATDAFDPRRPARLASTGRPYGVAFEDGTHTCSGKQVGPLRGCRTAHHRPRADDRQGSGPAWSAPHPGRESGARAARSGALHLLPGPAGRLRMKVWVEQADCMGSGLCGIIEPRMFVLVDGVAHVRGAEGLRPDGLEGAVEVPEDCRDKVFEASKCCVAACIYVQ